VSAPPFSPKGDAPGAPAKGTGGDDALDALKAALADGELAPKLAAWKLITLTRAAGGVDIDVDGAKATLPDAGGADAPPPPPQG
jgi:hypothetical protein